MPFVSFSCLIAWAGTFSIMLNGNEESCNSCFAADPIEKAFSLSPLSIMLAMCLSYMSFIMLRFTGKDPDSGKD